MIITCMFLSRLNTRVTLNIFINFAGGYCPRSPARCWQWSRYGPCCRSWSARFRRCWSRPWPPRPRPWCRRTIPTSHATSGSRRTSLRPTTDSPTLRRTPLHARRSTAYGRPTHEGSTSRRTGTDDARYEGTAPNDEGSPWWYEAPTALNSFAARSENFLKAVLSLWTDISQRVPMAALHLAHKEQQCFYFFGRTVNKVNLCPIQRANEFLNVVSILTTWMEETTPVLLTSTTCIHGKLRSLTKNGSCTLL